MKLSELIESGADTMKWLIKSEDCYITNAPNPKDQSVEYVRNVWLLPDSILNGNIIKYCPIILNLENGKTCAILIHLKESEGGNK